MNLEYVEQKCLSYLQQVSNPLVPVVTLVEHLRSDDDCQGGDERELLAFLRGRDLFRVIESPAGHASPEMAQELGEAGIAVGPRVILSTRVPTKGEIAGNIQEQLAKMTDALSGAMAQAKEMGNAEAEDQVLEALARAEKLKKMAQEVFEEET